MQLTPGNRTGCETIVRQTATQLEWSTQTVAHATAPSVGQYRGVAVVVASPRLLVHLLPPAQPPPTPAPPPPPVLQAEHGGPSQDAGRLLGVMPWCGASEMDTPAAGQAWQEDGHLVVGVAVAVAVAVAAAGNSGVGERLVDSQAVAVWPDKRPQMSHSHPLPTPTTPWRTTTAGSPVQGTSKSCGASGVAGVLGRSPRLQWPSRRTHSARLRTLMPSTVTKTVISSPA